MVFGVHWSVFMAWVLMVGSIIFSLLYFFLANKEEGD